MPKRYVQVLLTMDEAAMVQHLLSASMMTMMRTTPDDERVMKISNVVVHIETARERVRLEREPRAWWRWWR